MTAIGLILFLASIIIFWVDEQIVKIPYVAQIAAIVMLIVGLGLLMLGLVTKLWEVMP